MDSRRSKLNTEGCGHSLMLKRMHGYVRVVHSACVETRYARVRCGDVCACVLQAARRGAHRPVQRRVHCAHEALVARARHRLRRRVLRRCQRHHQQRRVTAPRAATLVTQQTATRSGLRRPSTPRPNARPMSSFLQTNRCVKT